MVNLFQSNKSIFAKILALSRLKYRILINAKSFYLSLNRSIYKKSTLKDAAKEVHI